MKKLMSLYLNAHSKMQSVVNNEKGATMVEYALMVALIAVICIGAVTTLQGGISGTFTGAAASL